MALNISLAIPSISKSLSISMFKETIIFPFSISLVSVPGNDSFSKIYSSSFNVLSKILNVLSSFIFHSSLFAACINLPVSFPSFGPSFLRLILILFL